MYKQLSRLITPKKLKYCIFFRYLRVQKNSNMLRKIFLITGIFICSDILAQITISSSDMPDAGDSILVSTTASIGGIDPILSDTNYLWNFSTLSRNAQHYEVFDSPFTFTSPFNLLFSILNTSYGKNNYTFTNIPIPGVSITAAYDFIKESSSSLKQVGAGYTINGGPIPFLYTSADYIYRFPMNYSNIDSCDYKYGLPIPTFGYYGQTGHRLNKVDGWGTLITPYGSFQTLRVRSEITATDTVFVTSLGVGSYIPRPLKYEFKWLAAGEKIPVLQIDANLIGSNLVISNVQYIDSVHSVSQMGIAENSTDKSNLIVYPNPCSNNFLLHYELQRTDVLKISVTDVFGKTIELISDETQTAGAHQYSLKIDDLGLNSGVYILKVQGNHFQKTQKIIVSK